MGRPGFALFCAATGFGAVIMHTTAVNIALPLIRDAFGGEVSGLQWCANAYALVFATLLLPCGAMADRFGARRVFLAGMVLLAATSVVSATAPRIEVLVAGQAVAGIGAAMVAPTSLALVRAAYADEGARLRAIGKLSLGLAAGFGLGPIVGGALAGLFGWRAVFLIDGPVAAGLALLAWRRVAPSLRGPDRLPAFGGVALGAVAVGALAFALTEGGHLGWTAPAVWIAVAVATAAAGAFLASLRSSARPLLPARLRAEPEVGVACAIGLLWNVAVYGEIFVLSLAFQEGRGLSPLQSGLLFLPQPIGTLIVAVRAGRILAGSGPRPLLVAGVAFSVVGSVLLLFFDRSPFGVLVAAGLLVNGVAGGLIVPAIHGMIAEGAPPDLVGIGSAALNASRQIGGVLGVATLGAIVGSGDVLAGARTAVAFAGLSQLMLVALIAWRVRAARRSPALVAPDCEMASA